MSSTSMHIIDIEKTPAILNDEKLIKIHAQFQQLLDQLRFRKLTNESIQIINENISSINNSALTGNKLQILIKKHQTAILKHIEKEYKLSTKNYYRNLWMLFGFTAFGLPIGVTFGLALDNIGLMGVGLPFGMAIGFFVGMQLDKRALRDGNQLDIEIKY